MKLRKWTFINQTFFLLFFVSILFVFPQPVSTNEPEKTLYIGHFSTNSSDQKIPDKWEPLTFEKIPSHTTYSLVKDNNTVVVKAVSRTSSSGLTRKIRIDPKEYPIIRWKWKATNIYQKGDVTRKEGDDYPARIYVTFEYNPDQVGVFEKAQFKVIRLIYGEYPPIGAINYIWASRAPNGTIVPNPYTDRAQMIVVESGKDALNTWVTEERNIYEDFKAAFGKTPPMISGIAIMTDSDNTREAAVTYYGDILFKTAGH